MNITSKGNIVKRYVLEAFKTVFVNETKILFLYKATKTKKNNLVDYGLRYILGKKCR